MPETTKKIKKYMNDINILRMTPTKVILGWLTKEEGSLWLAGRDQSKITPEMITKVELCRQKVSERITILDSENPLSDPSAELNEFISEFWKQPDTEAFRNEKWEIKIADLTKVRAAQPNIAFEQAKERTKNVDQGNMISIASISLPKAKEALIPINFDSSKNAWVISSANPNLRICTNFNAQIGPGITGFGFGITLSNSFLQVAECNGYFILRDGYHRAIGLLSNGIKYVPVLTRKFNTYNEVGMPSGLITHEEIFGISPPFLIDYLNDDVTAIVNTPVYQKTIIIQGLELSTT